MSDEYEKENTSGEKTAILSAEEAKALASSATGRLIAEDRTGTLKRPAAGKHDHSPPRRLVALGIRGRLALPRRQHHGGQIPAHPCGGPFLTAPGRQQQVGFRRGGDHGGRGRPAGYPFAFFS